MFLSQSFDVYNSIFRWYYPIFRCLKLIFSTLKSIFSTFESVPLTDSICDFVLLCLYQLKSKKQNIPGDIFYSDIDQNDKKEENTNQRDQIWQKSLLWWLFKVLGKILWAYLVFGNILNLLRQFFASGQMFISLCFCTKILQNFK